MTTEDRIIPNLATDESGAVMVEFIIVAPLLLTLMLMEFFFVDFNRFQISSQQMANTLAWKRVGENTNTAQSDADFSFTPPPDLGSMVPGLPDASVLGGALGVATNYKLISGITPAAISTVELPGLGGIQAAAIHAANMIQGHIIAPLGVNSTSLVEQDMATSLGAGEIGAPTVDLVYRNSTFIAPVVNVIHSGTWIGSTNADMGTSGEVLMEDFFLKVPSRGVSVNDPGSVYWGNKEKRMRYTDRYTILRDPVFFVGAVIQTFVSGGVFFAPEIPTAMDDAFGTNDLIPGLSAVTDGVASIGGLFTMAASLTEQAQPMRKVDKIVNTENHDEGGGTDYQGYTYPEKYRLSREDNTNSRRSQWE